MSLWTVFVAVLALPSLISASPACPPPPWFSLPQPAFAKHFYPQTIRLDYQHFQESGEEKLSLEGFFKGGDWAGNQARPLDHSGYGAHVFIIKTPEGEPIYSRSFSSLFSEWKTTREALSGKSRIFNQSIFFPRPLNPVILSLNSRDAQGGWKEVWTYEYRGRLDGLANTEDIEGLILHQASSHPAHTLDILIVADGYPQSHEGKAMADMNRFARLLLDSPPYNRYQSSITIRGLFTPTPWLGPEEPRKAGQKRNPKASAARPWTSFNTFGSARYLTLRDERSLRILASSIPHDALLVMVNTSRYGGAGVFRNQSVFVSDNDFDEYVFLHELGHAFGGLADEYYSSSVAYSDFYPAGQEPWEPNITALTDGAKGLKWRSLLSPGVPVPTPESPEFLDSTGVFEGAGYSAKGLFRPRQDCLMFSKKQQDPCLVCSCALEWMIKEEISTQDVQNVQ